MPQFSAEAIQRLEEVLRKDPNSQAFATLAEAYRTESRLKDAERIAAHGVKLHPLFTSGWVALGKILKDQKRPEESLEAFQKAIRLSPENLLALQMAGECLLELKRPKEALKLLKRVLFLSPQAEKAKRIVAKLESLTADEYGEEVFAMTKLSDLKPPSIQPTAPSDPTTKTATPADAGKGLLRFLSLVDAFIVRNDISRASQLLDETRREYGEHPEIDQRQKLLQRRRSAQLGLETEQAAPLQPIASREDRIRERKIALLQATLQRIQELPDALR
ncbi:MAG TPA: tetratricopeptide repeat protein [Pseudobdellovibrionaceae bacterium]|nr:tetratricopeptide repeat protein [Pseudobdellovibrionaceae bacterium]